MPKTSVRSGGNAKSVDISSISLGQLYLKRLADVPDVKALRLRLWCNAASQRDEAGNVIETHEHKGEFEEPCVSSSINPVSFSSARTTNH
jgi:hypothetical protein